MTTPTTITTADRTTGDLHLTHGAAVREPVGRLRANPGVVPLTDSARALLTGAGLSLDEYDAAMDEVLGGGDA